MADPLTLYTHPMSRGRIARWMLEETGQPYEAEFIEYGAAMKAPDYLAVNPMGKVPAIKHGATVVTECAAICAYLADAFPDTGLAPPAGDRLRGPYYRGLFFAAGPLEAAVTNKAFGVEITSEQERMAGYGDFARVLSVIEEALSGSDYIAGDRFSAADVYLGSHIGWGMQFGTMEKNATFESYFDRLSARAAFKRAGEIDEALMASHPHPAAGT
jgi:glutathione S-transferase